MAKNKSYSATVTPLEGSMVEIKVTIPWDVFSVHEKKAFDRLASHLELPGFRPGKIPADVAKKHIPDELVLSDMAELAVQELYVDIIKDQNIDAIGRPELSITKLARDNELGVTIKTAVLPEIKLPDYKTIARGIEKIAPTEVTEEEVDKVIEELRQLRAYGHVHTEGDEHKHDEPLPEVTDEFAKSFGSFETVADLRGKIREKVAKEKARDAQDKNRINIMEAVIAETSFAVPAIILSSEQEKMYAQIEADVARMGLTMEDYLAHSKKTKEQLFEEYKPEAEKRARYQLVINAIAKDAKLAPSDEEVEAEAEKLAAMYPGAEKARTAAYADMVLTNEKVLSMLETA